MSLWDFLVDRREVLVFQGFQHASMVAQSVVLAAVLAVVVAALVHRDQRAVGMATAASAVGLTIPSFALLGLLIAPLGIGVAPAVTALVFYASLPILRNAVVGLAGVDTALVDAARGMGMSRLRTLLRIELPLAWPVILAGIRVSTQMVMGIGAIAAYVSVPVWVDSSSPGWPDWAAPTPSTPPWQARSASSSSRWSSTVSSCSSANSRPRGGSVSDHALLEDSRDRRTPEVEGHGVPIDLVDVTKRYPGQQAPAVENVNLRIPAGEIVVLVGPSGCGKTTTMKMINRLIEPTSGQILLGGEDVTRKDADQLRRGIGYVIQSGGLFPHLTVGANVGIVRVSCAGSDPEPPNAWTNCSSSSVSTRPATATATRANCRAGNNSASASPGHWQPTHRCS